MSFVSSSWSTDAHRFVVFQCHLDDGRELFVPFILEADVAGIDAVLVERFGTSRVVGQQLVADVVEVADNRHVGTELPEPVLNVRHGRGRFVAIDGNAHQFGARCRERGDLPRGAFDIGRVGIGHGLHDDRRAAAHGYAADADCDRFVTR
jgi:hypothetical protein